MARTAFSEAVFERILGRIASGESIASICKDKDMPAQSTFYVWLDQKENLAERYARARETQADAIFDEIISIADDGQDDEDNAENVQRSRLRVDARKWVAAKLAPKKYGDRVALDHTVSSNLADRFARAEKRTAEE
ncbi:hypothetical protein [Henriciella sp.]|uniref:terminase small subunit-like protein n=1 Tax=Henriciella sp. TaxID=1968823 RepID=UPI002633F931|nr:hypothetical protein [Henriciella sp.]